MHRYDNASTVGGAYVFRRTAQPEVHRALLDMATMHPDPKKPFLSDIQEIRKRARKHMEKGAVTEGYQADLETVLRLLNEALATEIVCVLRYKRHQFMAHGLNATSVAEEFA